MTLLVKILSNNDLQILRTEFRHNTKKKCPIVKYVQLYGSGEFKCDFLAGDFNFFFFVVVNYEIDISWQDTC